MPNLARNIAEGVHGVNNAPQVGGRDGR